MRAKTLDDAIPLGNANGANSDNVFDIKKIFRSTRM